MISVIIPVYNAENHLEKCINSLVNQTYKNLEIILVNDGSTDNSGTLCDSFAARDSRIKVIHKQNGGVSSARNAGLDAATGKYITFADSDDWVDTSAFDICIAEMEQNNLDLLVCGYNTVFADKTTTTYMDCNMFTRYEYKENIARYITTSVGFNSVWNKIYLSHIINRHHIRFDETMQINEDGVFNCKYFTASHYVKCIPNAFYYYNMTNPSSTARGRIDYLPQGKKFSQAMIDATQSKGLYSYAAEAINDFYRHMLHIHLMFLLLPNDKISTQQRIQAIEQLYNTHDGAILETYLSSLSGIKNKLFYLLYKTHCSKLLITCVKLISGGK